MEESSELQQALRQEIEDEAESLLADARHRGKALLKEAEGLAERRHKEAGRHIEQKASVRRRQALARARQEGRIALLNARRTEIQKVIEAVRGHLDQLRDEDPERYGDLLWSFYLQGRGILQGEPLKVTVDSRGKACLKRLEKEDGVEIAVDDSLQGLIMKNATERKLCDFRLDALLKQVRAWREAELAGLLFEEIDE